KDKTLLGGLCHGINSFSIMGDGKQIWRGRKIPVQDIVVHKLKMPEALSGIGIQGNQAVGKKIFAGTVSSVKIKGSRACRSIDDTTFIINSQSRPVIGTSYYFIGMQIGRPGIIAKFPGSRYGIDYPFYF